MKLSLLLLPGWLLAGSALAQTAATFAPVATYSTGLTSFPIGLAVADVNGDGKPDVLTANTNGSTAGVLLGTGTGTFGAVTAYSTGPGSAPISIAVADVNGDGKPDLLTANSNSNTVGVLLGTGTGTFGAVATYSTGAGSMPDGIAVADVNGDSKLDVLTANYGTNTVGVLLGTGTGSFPTLATYSTGPGSLPGDIYVADVNGDSRLDVLTPNYGSNSAAVLLGTGTGSFGAVTTYSTGPNGLPVDLVVADVNRDGKLDLLTANSNSDTAGVLLGTGTGTFGAVTTYSTGTGGTPDGIAVADVNGDNRPDLLTANIGTNTVGVLLGTGTGSFGVVTTYSTGAGSGPIGIEVADVNGDGRRDIIVVNSNTNTVGVLLNTTGVLPTLTALPGAAANLHPNPTRTSATLTATGLPAAATQVVVVLLNPLGQEVRRLSVPATAGVATGAVPTAGLASGLYLLRLDAVDAQGAALGALATQRLSVE